ncbi:haloacid dehalogenase family hydrolase [Weissella kandleri]|uniref:Haloacid dehalogenase family hydrolase n=1 Tax=Weissella kandleri TaxID=1616 RepID=A0A0R2JDM8_9LACO|nr:YqeG family HAD IIIA-type phosphatase [Weissella kandleri]KRN75472.1 haloacid dehalogenase family hydrolase [Weissella kandleri]
MKDFFKPTWQVHAIYQLDPADLKRHGIQAVLTDLDNTLIAWNNPDGTTQLHEWLLRLEKAQIPVMIVSNNSAERIERVAEPLHLKFIARALKPTTHGLQEALTKLQLAPKDVVMVGDQLLTDIMAANAMRMRSVLVEPLIDTDQWNTKINRFFEKGVKKHLKRQYPELQWRNNLDK